MENCKTCKYYNPNLGYPNDKGGVCNRIGMNERLISDAQAHTYIAFHKDNNPQSVSVGENFGCVKYQENNG